MSTALGDLPAIPADELPVAIRSDVVLARFAIAGSPAGPDRIAGKLALERLVRRLVRTEDDTREIPAPASERPRP